MKLLKVIQSFSYLNTKMVDTFFMIILFLKIKYEIVHLMMLLGSQLGDETFYALFFAFWFWNISEFKPVVLWIRISGSGLEKSDPDSTQIGLFC